VNPREPIGSFHLKVTVWTYRQITDRLLYVDH